MSPRLLPYREDIILKYTSGQTMRSIAKLYNTCPESIRCFLRDNNIQTRSGGQTTGAIPWNKGKKFCTDQSIKLIESGEYIQRIINLFLLFVIILMAIQIILN